MDDPYACGTPSHGETCRTDTTYHAIAALRDALREVGQEMWVERRTFILYLGTCWVAIALVTFALVA